MVLPSSVLSRGAMGMSCIAGGKPRGLTAVILPGSDLTTGELLAAALASLEEPARIAGDAPMSDNSFRRFTFMLNQPPKIPAPSPKAQVGRLARRARASEIYEPIAISSFRKNNRRLFRSRGFK